MPNHVAVRTCSLRCRNQRHFSLYQQMWWKVGFRVKVVLLVYVITFIVMLPLVLWDQPGSLYFIEGLKNLTETRIRVEEENTKRVVEAQEYVSTWNNARAAALWKRLGEGPDSDVPSIVMCTVSKYRRSSTNYQPRYLTQQVAKMLELLETRGPSVSFKLQFFVCNVENNQSAHTEAVSLSPVVPVHNRFNSGGKGKSSATAFTQSGSDYAWCLNNSLQYGSDFVLMLEDDALPEPDMLDLLTHATRHVTNSYSRASVVNRTNQTAWVKLYHSNRYLGYISPEPNRLVELLSTGVILGGLLAFLFHKMCRTRTYWKTFSFDLYVLWIIFSIYVVLVLLVIGRSNLLIFRRYFAPYLYSVVPAPKHFAQAMVFPAHSAKKAVDFLNSSQTSSDYKKDLALYEYAKHNNLQAFYVEPDGFRHVGLVSSMHKADTNPIIFLQ